MFLEDMSLTNILLSALSVLIMGLATWLSTVLVNFLNTKIKDKKVAAWLTQITDIVFTCVREVTQTYVSSLKDKNMFDEAAQKEALNRCIEKVKSQLSEDAKKFITDNYGDLESWLTTQIESAINSLK